MNITAGTHMWAWNYHHIKLILWPNVGRFVWYQINHGGATYEHHLVLARIVTICVYLGSLTYSILTFLSKNTSQTVIFMACYGHTMTSKSLFPDAGRNLQVDDAGSWFQPRDLGSLLSRRGPVRQDGQSWVKQKHQTRRQNINEYETFNFQIPYR